MRDNNVIEKKRKTNQIKKKRRDANLLFIFLNIQHQYIYICMYAETSM